MKFQLGRSFLCLRTTRGKEQSKKEGEIEGKRREEGEKETLGVIFLTRASERHKEDYLQLHTYCFFFQRVSSVRLVQGINTTSTGQHIISIASIRSRTFCGHATLLPVTTQRTAVWSTLTVNKEEKMPIS